MADEKTNKPGNPTPAKEQKGYAGSADHFDGNRNVDPDQASPEQQLRQERGEPLNGEQTTEPAPAKKSTTRGKRR